MMMMMMIIILNILEEIKKYLSSATTRSCFNLMTIISMSLNRSPKPKENQTKYIFNG